MNLSTKRLKHTVRPLITCSAAGLLMLSQTSCGISGMLGRNKDSDSAQIASDEPKKKKKPFSLFNRSKDRNAYIKDDAQTTRRDRLARQNNPEFAASMEPAVSPAPTGIPDPMLNTNAQPSRGPLTPNNDLELDPVSSYNNPPQPATRVMADPEESLRLPTLDSDFPPPNAPTNQPSYREPSPRRTTSDDGYIPLQPRLPGAENILPPSE